MKMEKKINSKNVQQSPGIGAWGTILLSIRKPPAFNSFFSCFNRLTVLSMSIGRAQGVTKSKIPTIFRPFHE